MSHEDQLTFVAHLRSALPACFEGQRVLEVGSLDLNGSVRPLFSNCDYVGIDLGAGPGVDIVMPGESYDEPDGSFDVVTSCECMEHNPKWQQTTLNMLRLLRPGGLFILSCAAPGRPEHGTQRTNTAYDSPLTVELGQDYYRNLHHKNFARLPNFLGAFGIHAHWINWASRDYYFAGVKGTVPTHGERWREFTRSMDAWISERNGNVEMVPVKELLLRAGGTPAVEGFNKLVPHVRRLIRRQG